MTTRATNITVFIVPSTLRITNIFGNESAGPANRRAKAGPLPIPLANSPFRMGTSVKVAKYINAPIIEANRFDQIEFPPTKADIQLVGIKPDAKEFGLPNKNPAASTPNKSRGTICLVNVQVSLIQSEVSPSLLLSKIDSPIIPVKNVKL